MGSTVMAVERAEFVKEWSRYADEVKRCAADRRLRLPRPPAASLTRSGPTRNGATSTSRIARDCRLVLDAGTLAELRREELHWLGVECGGGLFGTRDANGMIYVHGLGRTHTDWRTGIVALPFRELEEDGQHFRAGTNWRLVGDWHCEPYKDDGLYGSGADRQAWKQCAYLNGGQWVGVVMSPRSDDVDRGADWTHPILNAWIAAPDDVKRLPLDYKWRVDGE
jgi:hypothetical protein